MQTPYKIQGKIKPGVARLWYRFYRQDPQVRFRDLIMNEVDAHYEVLEIGAGSGTGDQQSFPLKGAVKRYAGIDLDPRVEQNPNLDEAKVADAGKLPFADSSFDLVFHTMVAEHLAEPLIALRESYRVLKPGGKLIFETVNKYYYPMVIASMTPHWFHNFYIKRYASGRGEMDVFPTVYKLNSQRDIARICQESGFASTTISFLSLPPGYLRSSPLLFLAGVLYERTLEKLVSKLRGRIVARCIK